jgi:hypothetical protein
MSKTSVVYNQRQRAVERSVGDGRNNNYQTKVSSDNNPAATASSSKAKGSSVSGQVKPLVGYNNVYCLAEHQEGDQRGNSVQKEHQSRKGTTDDTKYTDEKMARPGGGRGNKTKKEVAAEQGMMNRSGYIRKSTSPPPPPPKKASAAAAPGKLYFMWVLNAYV